MKAVTICHANTAEAFRVGAYLEVNLDVRVYARAAEDLVAEVDFGLSGDAVVVLLSRGMVLGDVPRSEWEPVLRNDRVAYALLEDCTFPALLRRERFFDGRVNPINAYRGIKRWLLGNDRRAEPLPEHEELLVELADRPGIVRCTDYARATGFAHACAAEFERVVFIDGRGRTLPSISHEIADVRGRTLLLVRGAAADAIAWVGAIRDARTSVLATPPEAGPEPDVSSVRASLIAASRGEAAVEEPILDRTMQVTSDRDLVRLAVGYFKRQGRLGEALEALNRIHHGKGSALDDLARERIWILEQLETAGPQEPAVRVPEAEQLSLLDL